MALKKNSEILEILKLKNGIMRINLNNGASRECQIILLSSISAQPISPPNGAHIVTDFDLIHDLPNIVERIVNG